MKIIVKVLVVILIALACIFAWQYDNIQALYQTTKLSEEDIQTKLKENDTVVKQKVEELVGEAPFRELTEEEIQEIQTGKVTVDEITEKIVNETPKPEKKPGDPENPEADKKRALEETTGRYITKLYALKAYYFGELSGLKEKAVNEYMALPEAQRTSSNKQAMGKRYLQYGTTLEKACDAQVSELLGNLTKELKLLGGDLEIVKVLQKAYDQEKSLKKTQYLNEYL